jgi:multiple RNA-binding domain-containing protein 1
MLIWLFRSRLVLLNLPSTLTPRTLRDHLLTPPSLNATTITDLKLLQKRRLAFVGYKSKSEALKVKDWFDGSFALGGGRVKVDIVRDEVRHLITFTLIRIPAHGVVALERETY